MRRSGPGLFPGGEPSDAAIVLGAAQLVKTPDELSCLRRACRITEEAMAEVQKALAPGVRQTDLSAVLVRRAFELGATTNMLDAIWQVMPASRETGVWTTHGDLALPLLPTARELASREADRDLIDRLNALRDQVSEIEPSDELEGVGEADQLLITRKVPVRRGKWRMVSEDVESVATDDAT